MPPKIFYPITSSCRDWHYRSFLCVLSWPPGVPDPSPPNYITLDAYQDFIYEIVASYIEKHKIFQRMGEDPHEFDY